MVVPILLSSALIAWSLFANLVLGEHLYLARNLVLTGILLAAARVAGVSWTDLGLGRDELAAGLRWGRNAGLAVLLLVIVGILLRDVLPMVTALLEDRRADLPGAEVAWNVLVRIPLGTAVFEEVAFRGVLFASFLAVTSAGWAVAWSSLVFGLWHVAPAIVTLRINDVAPASPAGVRAVVGAVVVTTVAGVLFSLLRLVSGSLIAPILGHWATNGFGLLAATVAGDAPTHDRGGAASPGA